MEAKDLLKAMGIEEVNTIEDFNEKFNSRFLTRETAILDDEVKSKITGRITGAIGTIIKREFGLEPSEIKDLKWEDALKKGAEKLKQEKAELEELAGKGSDEKLNELQDKIKKYEKSISDYKTNLELTTNLVAQKETEYTQAIKSLKVENIIKDSKSKISSKIKSNMTEAEKFYFEHKIKESIDLDFDEKGDIIVLSKNGERMQNPNKIGAFMSVDEAIEKIAGDANILIKNNSGQSNQLPIVQTASNNNSTKKEADKNIHPSILARREKMLKR
jgi:hypothetical protein